MSKILRLLWPRRIGGQIVLLVFLSVSIAYVGSAVFVFNFRQKPPEMPQNQVFNEAISGVVRSLNATPDNPARLDLIATVNTLAPSLNLHLVPEFPQRVPKRPPGRLLRSIIMYVGGDTQAIELGDNMRTNMRAVVISLSDGSALGLDLMMPPRRPPILPPFIESNLIFLLAFFLSAVLFWVARGMSLQLHVFAKAAEDFSVGSTHAPIPETGPEEIRVAARALNRMRDRVTEYATDQTRMLSSIGHDLRTPVTRLRLRAEFITDPEVKLGVLKDITRMEAMIDSTLTFLRDGQSEGLQTAVNLPSLLQTICNEFLDTGMNITYVGPDKAQANTHVENLTRAVENLVQNAGQHATVISVRLRQNEIGLSTIDVDDDGPGLAADARADMMKPFVSGDKARSGDTRGFGLGLSITQGIARSLGGDLTLGESDLGGLRATIQLQTNKDGTNQVN